MQIKLENLNLKENITKNEAKFGANIFLFE
jgi:hypothetical protein